MQHQRDPARRLSIRHERATADLPLQILFLNLVIDVFPALALGMSEGGDEVMHRPPRGATEPILKRAHWIAMAGWAALITGAVLAAFWMAFAGFGMTEARAVTVSFLTLAFAQLWHVFDMRSRGSSLLHKDVVGNRWVWGALVLCTAMLFSAVFLPPLARILHVEAPSADGWLLIAGMSVVPVVVGQALRSGGGKRTGTGRYGLWWPSMDAGRSTPRRRSCKRAQPFTMAPHDPC